MIVALIILIILFGWLNKKEIVVKRLDDFIVWMPNSYEEGPANWVV